MTTDDVRRAIGIVLYSQKTHQDWLEFIQDGFAERKEIELVGDVSYQQSRIRRYEDVLAVLRSHPLAPNEQIAPLQEMPE